ncbi:MAG TPA: glycerophosphodiester phosphodiesterase [Novosphingobium sp.]|nr:glycerophosphodiester phosphodiesterase [Novosphingobium sp.]
MMGSLSRRRLMGTATSVVLGGMFAGGNPVLAKAALAGGTQPRPVPARLMGQAGKALVIGHRGCSALRPEHTLASYAKAIADGADFIEPDLVATKDGVLIARHENNIAETSDVATRPEFADRHTTKTIDGEKVTGWFTEDFTLAEIKTLRAKERLGALRPESRSFDGQFQIVTFEEIADFTAAEAAARGRQIGLIPEIKHSTYFAGIGLPLEGRFLAALGAHHYLSHAPLVVQSFEVANLKRLRRDLAGQANVQLMQLVGAPDEAPADFVAAGDKRRWRDLLTPQGLDEVATHAHWLAPPTRMIVPVGAHNRLGAPTGIVEAGHRAGLLVGTWTFRPENHFIAADFTGPAPVDGARNPAASVAEIRRYLATGLDGFFTDDPALGRQAVEAGPAAG